MILDGFEDEKTSSVIFYSKGGGVDPSTGLPIEGNEEIASGLCWFWANGRGTIIILSNQVKTQNAFSLVLDPRDFEIDDIKRAYTATVNGREYIIQDVEDIAVQDEVILIGLEKKSNG